ncbi:uncharacterized protein B0J16DRAFT_388885 [Fusarium flagelliforme]|uniref:Uncharacterized protein n=1 Tax=Fusarium flagelliforme TaxID=2675880 RepID=A0A395MG81_9HYPO|nr:uncharacterized protein B0J16DRAFT_388885 [Fusarium flagelliforme]KAH7175059.1 hypothetical protein B0J16DRAFT_388885 [Fusarium flagelliforme]RFN46904.1 hypothetical protein FIE12Z_8837 [Fusarium flagelliforme]
MAPLTKRLEDQLKTYLEAAKPSLLTIPEPVVGQWSGGHGEGRSTAKVTFHIDFMFTSAGKYMTRLTYNQGKRKIPIDGTKKEWGEKIDPTEVLTTYQEAFGVAEQKEDNNKKKN